MVDPILGREQWSTSDTGGALRAAIQSLAIAHNLGSESMRTTLILMTGILCGVTAVSSRPHAAAIHAELTAEELVAKNTEARGGLAKIKAIKSLRMTGPLQQGDFSATVGSEVKAPN